MLKDLNTFWRKASRIGLYPHEDEMQYREVIIMNKVIMFVFFNMIVYVPIEIYINGIQMIPFVLLMNFFITSTLIFHYLRWFTCARYYLFLVSSIFVVSLGVAVGRGINNHVILIPILLAGILIFKSNFHRVLILILTLCFYFIQINSFNVITPALLVDPKVKELFSIIFFVMAILLVFAVGFYSRNLNIQYENIINEQKDKLEIRNKEIGDSIIYAKRIQTAILPPTHLIDTYLKNYFIYYRPKDIVAGDFFWFEKINDYVFFAAADCTGHGVPGAMVSVICNNALNRAVREFDLIDSGKILEKARTIIIQEFSKSAEDVKDGMDISLCVFNTKANQLNWAGANNPLWILRNGSIIEFKPDKQPVGKHYNQKNFTSHEIKLIKGDRLFVFTDGYQDQFGGVRGKKFKASALKKLIETSFNFSLSEQREILHQTFMNWKEAAEQVDDICMIGVEID